MPAHDEAAVIARCVRSLRAQSYPRHLYEIVVIADNCTDNTVGIAAHAGADRVMNRCASPSGGKGGALRWALDQILVANCPPSGVVIVDADSFPGPGFLTALVQPFEAKRVRVVQGMSLLAPSKSCEPSLGVIAFMLFNRVRPPGRAVLHVRPTNLVGNGMLLARSVLLEHPWQGFTSSEDLEYSITLHLAKETIAFAPSAGLPSPPAPNAAAARQQQLRWHGGRAHLARVWMPRLVRRAVLECRPSLLRCRLGAEFSPRLGLLAAATAAGLILNLALEAPAAIVAWWSLLPWVVALAAIALSVVVGLRAGDTPQPVIERYFGRPSMLRAAAVRAGGVLT